MFPIERHGVTKRWADMVIHNHTAYFVEVPDDIDQDAASQIDQVLSQTEARLVAVGSSKANLLQVIIYLPDPAHFALLNEKWEAWLPEGQAPTRACIHAKLAAPALAIELIITAGV